MQIKPVAGPHGEVEPFPQVRRGVADVATSRKRVELQIAELERRVFGGWAKNPPPLDRSAPGRAQAGCGDDHRRLALGDAGDLQAQVAGVSGVFSCLMPASISSFTVPATSSIGTFGSTRCW